MPGRANYNANINEVIINFCRDNNVGLVARKPAFRVSDKVRFKPTCSAAYTSLKDGSSLVASLDMIHR